MTNIYNKLTKIYSTDRRKEIVEDNKYPIVFRSFVYCLSKDEILAEKVRALLNREKSRDIYDMWMLLELGAKFDKEMISKKFEYNKQEYNPEEIVTRLESQSKDGFIKDLKAFVPINERDKLGDFFEYVKENTVKEMVK